jgi:hypothetical protein
LTRTRTATPTPTRTLTPTQTTQCCTINVSHIKQACQVGGTCCIKTIGTIKVNGVSVYSFGTGAACGSTTNTTISACFGDIIRVEIGAVDPPAQCSLTIFYSEIAADVQGNYIYAQSPSGPGDPPATNYSQYTLSSCSPNNITFYSNCS